MKVATRRLAVVTVLALGLTTAATQAESPSPAAASSTPAASFAPPAVVTPEELGRADFRLVFGSCSKHDRPQPLWGSIRGMKADAFLWLGDAVYADVKMDKGRHVFLGHEYLVDAYKTQLSNPEYKALTSETRVLGVWDDHDFGMNNAGAEWSEKSATKDAYLNFLGEPMSSPRRKREGLFESYTYRGLGENKDRSVRVVLLDTRYAMSVDEGVLLGEEQWAWLEALLAPEWEAAAGSGSEERTWSKRKRRKKLTEGYDENRDNDPVDLTIIGSSIQVHSDLERIIGGIFKGMESWGQFPGEKERLMDLVARGGNRAIFLSGDVHHSDIGTSPAGCELPYELVEVTSSGMTHGVLDEIRHPTLRALAEYVVPDVIPGWLWPPVGRLQRPKLIAFGFAEVAVDFEDNSDGSEVGSLTGSVRLHVRNAEGKVKLRKTVRLADLSKTWVEVSGNATTGGLSRDRDECKTETNLTRWQKFRMPMLCVYCFVVQPVLMIAGLGRLYHVALSKLLAIRTEQKEGKKDD